MSGFVRLAEGILFWQVQETGSRVSEGIFTEAVFLGISVLVGMGLFLLYDIFRIFRRIVPHGAILDWSGRLLLLVTMHCCGFSDAVSGRMTV